MEVKRRAKRRRGDLTLAGPLIFLLVIWLGSYFAWRIVHGERERPSAVTQVVYPDDRLGRLTYDLFLPLRRLDAHYLGVESRLGVDLSVHED